MPNTKISALTAGNPALGTDQLPISRSGVNFQVTAASIAALSPAGTVTSVAVSGGTTGLTTSGGPVTASGTITLAGTLALANGGTGQTTKAAAFNALSPVTTTGDLIIGNGSNSNTRLAIGTSGYYLTSNGSTASWQALSVSAGSISGTLQPYQGGTGTSSSPTSTGQLLIGNGFGGYNVNTLTAGTGVTITNGSGTITIAASGGGGPTINTIYANTSAGGFGMSAPGSGYSRPLVGYTDTGVSQYGAFFYTTNNTGSSYTSLTVSSLQIQDTSSNFFNYSSGPDFFASQFNVNNSVVGCYNISTYSSSLKTLFGDSSNALDTNSLKPVIANSGPMSQNPSVGLSMSGGPLYSCSSGSAILVSYVSGSTYFLSFASGNTTPATDASTGYTINNMYFQINGSMQSYALGSDYTISFWGNYSTGDFQAAITPINPSLTTLLTNSAPGA